MCGRPASDNTKTAVTRACRYDPDLNPTQQEFAVHCGMGAVPARPYEPRDKAKVESGVQVVERWIVAALRNRKFFSLAELNQAIRELLVRLFPPPKEILTTTSQHVLARTRNPRV